MRKSETYNFQKLSKEEINSLIKQGDLVRSTSDRVIKMIEDLKLGEGFVLKRSEWPSRTPPDILLRKKKYQNLFKISLMATKDKEGWLIIKK